MRGTYKYQTLLLAAGLVLAPPTHAQFGGGAGGGTGGSGGGGGFSGGGSGGLGGGSPGGGVMPIRPSGAPGAPQMPSPGTGTPTGPGGGSPCGLSAQCGPGTGGGGNTGGATSGGGGTANPSPAGAAAAAPASTPKERDLRVTNKCNKRVRIAIRFRDASITWNTWGWWDIKPGDSSFVSYNGHRLRSNNSVFYIYATGDGVEWTGESTGHFSGEDYKFRKVILHVKPDDTFELALTCGG